jgi:hypothetical protein
MAEIKAAATRRQDQSRIKAARAPRRPCDEGSRASWRAGMIKEEDGRIFRSSLLPFRYNYEGRWKSVPPTYLPGTSNSTQVSADAPPLSRLTPRRATALESDAAARANKFRAVLAAQVGLEFVLGSAGCVGMTGCRVCWTSWFGVGGAGRIEYRMESYPPLTNPK